MERERSLGRVFSDLVDSEKENAMVSSSMITYKGK